LFSTRRGLAGGFVLTAPSPARWIIADDGEWRVCLATNEKNLVRHGAALPAARI